MEEARDADIASKEEVLETYTQLMRGEKTAEQLKAADALAKYHGLFTTKEEENEKNSPQIAQAVEAAVAQALKKGGRKRRMSQ